MEHIHTKRKRLIRSGGQSSLDALLTRETLVQKELIRGYRGQNGAKGHKAVAKSKIHPDYSAQNLKQQAGFDAEINMVTRDNIHAIRNKSNIRAYRTDELGQVNDPTADIVWIDERTGERIHQSSVQLKFRGKTGAENVRQFLTKKEFGKYQDQWLAIPTEQLNDAHQYLTKRIDSYNEQINRLRQRGEVEKAQQILDKKKNAESVKSRLIDGGSQSDAMNHRLRPLREHLKRSVKEAHVAGKQAALQGATISSVLASPFILHRLIVDEAYTWKEAGGDYAKIVATSTLSNYVITGATVLIQGQLSASSKAIAKQIAKTNVIGQILNSSVDLSQNIYRLLNDSNYQVIDFLTDTSEHVTGTFAAAFLTTAVKQAVPNTLNPLILTIPGMIGYAAGQYVVKELIRLNRKAKLAKEKRLEIEVFCLEMTKQLSLLHQEVIQIGERDTLEWETIHSMMREIRYAITPEQINQSIIRLAEQFEIKLRLTNFDEFDEMMSDSTIPFIL
ncbi:hypothetical protein [Exiguobacterium sp. s6]|uniref:hypothetical protein n=1 Tax=Exiguobacterium sp. s6 TaxID=2751236 RepID=UPI001BE6A29D|nr:hypothetical protein [Exiguobacterium sp. s6]